MHAEGVKKKQEAPYKGSKRKLREGAATAIELCDNHKVLPAGLS